MTLDRFLAKHSLPPPLLNNYRLDEFKDRYFDLPKQNCDYAWVMDTIEYYEDPNAYAYLFIHLYPHLDPHPSVAI
jgi:hypothetical protein